MPNYDVQAPNGKTYTVQAPEGATEQSIINSVQQYLTQSSPLKPEVEKAGFFDAIGSGIDLSQKSYGSAIEGLGGVLGAKGLEQYGADVVKTNEQELAKQAGKTSFKDVQEAEGFFDTAGAVGSFGAGALGESLPQMGVNIAGSVAGAKLGARLGSVAGVPGAVVGGIAGGLAGAIPFFYGDNREAQKESIQQGLIEEVNEGAAFLGSVPQAALDVVVDRFLFGLTKKGLDLNLDDILQKGGVFTRGAKNVAAGASIEIPTEIGQEVISRFQAGQAIDSPEAIESYIEIGAAAGLVGGAVRGASGVVRGDKEAQKIADDKLIEDQEANLAATPAVEETDEETPQLDLNIQNEYEEDVRAAQEKLDSNLDEQAQQKQDKTSGGIDSDRLTQVSLQEAKNEIFDRAGKDDFAISDEEAAEYLKTGKHPFITEEYVETPVVETPVVETAPVVETPVVETAPVVETPVVEAAPVVETPVVEAAPVVEAPAVEDVVVGEDLEAEKIVKTITDPSVTLDLFRARQEALGSSYKAIEELGSKELVELNANKKTKKITLGRQKALLHLAGDINTSPILKKDYRSKDEITADEEKKLNAQKESKNVFISRAADISETKRKLKNIDLSPTIKKVKDEETKKIKKTTSYPRFGSALTPAFKYSGGKNAWEFYRKLPAAQKTFVKEEIIRLKTLELRADRVKTAEDQDKLAAANTAAEMKKQGVGKFPELSTVTPSEINPLNNEENFDEDGYPIDDFDRAETIKKAARNRKKAGEAKFKLDPLEIKTLNDYKAELLEASPELAGQPETLNGFLNKKLIEIRTERYTEKFIDLVERYESDGQDSVSLPITEETTTVEETLKVINDRFNNYNIGNIVSVTETPEEAGLSGIGNSVGGAVVNKKVYLFTNRIQKGNEFGVFMHEIGAHLGMKNLIGATNYNFILNKIKEFEKSNSSDSRGAQIAKAARARIEKAQSLSVTELTDEQTNNELIAYFIEEAIYKGVDPLTIAKQPSEFGSVFKRIVAAFKNALSKIGFKFKSNVPPINEQDIVDLAYGGAAFELYRSQDKYSPTKLEKLFTNPSENEILSDVLQKLNSLQDVNGKTGYSDAERFILGGTSNIKNTMRRWLYRTLSFYQMADEVRRIGKEGTELSRKSNELADNIRKLEYIAAKRRRLTDDNRRAFTDALVLATQYRDDALQGLSSQQQKELLKEFSDIAHSSSIEQLDLRDYFKQPQDRNPDVVLSELYKRFSALPAPLRKAYVVMANEYEVAGNTLIEAQRKLMGDNPTPEQIKQLQELIGKRLVPYFPLLRNGSYWIDVSLPKMKLKKGTDEFEASSEFVTHTFTFESEAEASKAESDYKKQGFQIDRSVYNRGVSDSLKDGSYTAYSRLLNQVSREKITDPKELASRKTVIEVLQQAMQDSFPSESIRQQYKKRKGTPGYDADVFKNFANMSFKLSNELTQIQTLEELNNSIDVITTADPKIDERLNDAVAVVAMKASFLRNPTPSRFSGMAAYAGYNAYLAGNISSSVVNLTQLPIVTFPKLYSEFGLVKSTAMMISITNKYVKNVGNPSKGRDDNTALKDPVFGWSLADVTIFTKEALAADPGLQKLYDAAKDRGGIRRTTSQELQDARKSDGAWRLGGDIQKAELALSWAFQNSERANREIGIYAAYKLGIQKGYKQDEAIQRALDITEEASGTALAELGPQIFMDGPGKVIGTFKRFAFSQLYLQYKLLRQSLGYIFPASYKPDSTMPIDPATGKPVDARAMAVKQLAGINVMAWTFAGATGTPFYGIGYLTYTLGNATLEALGAEDEDRLSFNAYIKKLLPEIAWQGPVSYYTNANFNNRVGLSPQNLLFRHDPRKMDELGFWYLPAQLAGPTVSYAEQVFWEAPKTFFESGRERPFLDSIQKALPAAIKNPIKAVRLLTDGAVNNKGVPLDVDITKKDAAFQFFGFSPTNVADRWENAGFVYALHSNIAEEAKELKDLRFWALEHDDDQGFDEVMERIYKFNSRELVQDIGQELTAKKLKASYKSKEKYQYESLYGISLDPETARTLYDAVTKKG